jgi:hypothetical protein
MKEEVILRILAQESSKSELRLRRYGEKKLRGFFCNFWKVARGIFGNISKTRGLLRIFVDYGLITKKPRWFFAMWRGFSSSGFIL